eukprot:11347763-Alexandrium_andersonii.AAC.1
MPSSDSMLDQSELVVAFVAGYSPELGPLLDAQDEQARFDIAIPGGALTQTLLESTLPPIPVDSSPAPIP